MEWETKYGMGGGSTYDVCKSSLIRGYGICGLSLTWGEVWFHPMIYLGV